MSKEYHVFTQHKSTHDQAFVFEVDRTETENEDFLNILELWIVTVQKDGEVKSRINFNDLVKTMGKNVGGNIKTESMPELLKIFDDVLSDQKKKEIEIDLMKKDIDLSYNTDSEKLIRASEYSMILETDQGNIQAIVDNIINKRKQ